MHPYLSGLASETSPGVSLAVAVLTGSLVSYLMMRKPRRGRARSALAYLLGLVAGLAASIGLAVFLQGVADPALMVGPSILGAFFGPFVGILRAKWEKPPKRRRRPDWIGSAS